MGQKVHPTGIRLGISKPWTSTWYANTAEYADNLFNDHQVRQYLTKQLKSASLSKIVIERPAKSIRVTIHTARPGVVIGKKGEDVEKLRNHVSKLAGVPAQINIAEVRKPELDAQLVADSISSQLERRVMFRRAMKRAVQNAMRGGALGVKIQVGGRLGGGYGHQGGLWCGWLDILLCHFAACNSLERGAPGRRAHASRAVSCKV